MNLGTSQISADLPHLRAYRHGQVRETAWSGGDAIDEVSYSSRTLLEVDVGKICRCNGGFVEHFPEFGAGSVNTIQVMDTHL